MSQICDIFFPESLSVSQAATVYCYCPKITYLHEHFQHFSISAVSCKQISTGPEASPPSFFSISLFARKDTIFDGTLFFFLLLSAANNIYFLLFWTFLLGLTGQVCSDEDRVDLLQDMVAASDTYLVPFLTFLKVLS